MVYVASLNSGSNGNCYYIGTATSAVLVDAGISCREIEKRMRQLDLSMDKVKAIFISHEHIDHIKGVEVLAKRYNLPVYITTATLGKSFTKPPAHLAQPFFANVPVTVNELSVTAFPKWHDAVDAHSFIVSAGGINIGVFTDIGAPCEHVIHHFGKCHAAFLEANYDDEMLANGRYPYHLKKRISGDHGHMSNAQAVALFMAHKPAQMSHLWLSHLSKDNNHPDVAMASFQPHAGSVAISVASRYHESEVFCVGASTTMKPEKVIQASLFA